MKKSLTLAIILVLLCTAQSYAKTVKGYYPTGVLQYIEHLNSKNQLTGWYKFYFPNGKLKEVGHYRNGVKVGTVQRYYADGTPVPQ